MELVVIALFGLLWVVLTNTKSQNREKGELASFAHSLSLERVAHLSEYPLTEFAIGTAGRNPGYSNCYRRSAPGGEFRVFEFYYDPQGFGQDTLVQKKYMLTVLQFCLDEAEREFPRFFVAPDALLFNVKAPARLERLQLNASSAFLENYRVYGESAADVEEYFTQERQRQLLRLPEFCLESNQRAIILYHNDTMLDAIEVDRALEVLQLFVRPET